MNSSTLPPSTPEPARTWVPDLLGEGFRNTSVHLGTDPDGETDPIATVVRYCPDPDDESFAHRPAVLWIHGMSDYFFHPHVARWLHDNGYACYAIDLRKCGRSFCPGQSRHHITDLKLYDEELNAALDIITEQGHPRIAPMGHSTGGLIEALWLDRLRTCDPQRYARISCAVFNSPWFELPLKGLKLRGTKAVVALMAKLRPNADVPDEGLAAYGKSLHISEYGEWDFDLAHKPLAGFSKKFSWLDAIRRSQTQLAKGIETGVPNLVMHSDASRLEGEYSPATDTADAVLYVDHIADRAAKIGSQTTIEAIPGARHDVFLSKEHARQQAMARTLEFLHTHMPTDVAPAE
ncbi:alpha/beta hydrolase [Corynebacterium sp. TAE3-ERU12]|nr:alpha/beta hydrolase [Corynebacterium sp. TAE3-ERU12]